MAITLEANYSKKLGLPGYSSHQYSVTVRTELSDLNLWNMCCRKSLQIEGERTYSMDMAEILSGNRQIGFKLKYGTQSKEAKRRKRLQHRNF